MDFPLEEKTVKIKRGESEEVFVLRELTADEFYSIQDQCIDKKTEDYPLDTHKLNLMMLAKSIKQPSLTQEGVAKLPKAISERLLIEFKILNSIDKTFFLENPEKPQKSG